MKIDGLDPTKPNPPEKQKSAQSSPGESFGKILSELEGAGGPAKPREGAPSAPVSSVPFITPPVVESSASAELIGSLEKTLTDLSIFANALGNTGLPLERLDPIVDELAVRKDELASMLKTSSDDEIKGIVTDVLAVLLENMADYSRGYAA